MLRYALKYFPSISSFEPLKTMSIFTQTLNPMTGKSDWIMENEHYDYHQEVARSGYADMLHDTERNKMYYEAIKKAIKLKKQLGEKIHVLDIGTGTGLLSMMAANSGADIVTACEAFTPMAKCATEIIKKNGFQNIITVIPKRSTELTVGLEGDMKTRANILVTEVFDTELIGEGALYTYTHALEHLLSEKCIVVPTAATVYAQIVSSSSLANWNNVKPININGTSMLNPPENIANCCGASAVHDLQLTEFPLDEFEQIVEPVKVFEFDFSGEKKLEFNEKTNFKLKAEKSGNCDAIFMWWDLKMDYDSQSILSCAPVWAHPTPNNMQWRDHWMQAVYYPEKSIKVEKDEEFDLTAFHDEFSLWFRFDPPNNCDNKLKTPVCSCRFHVLNSRTRVGMLNDHIRNNKYINLLKKFITPNTICLSFGDGCLLPLIAAKLGAKHVYVIENTAGFADISHSFIECNNLTDKVSIISGDIDEKKITQKVDLVIAEPFFTTSLLPWHNSQFWHSIQKIPCNILSEDLKIIPENLSIYGVGVSFTDLSKIRYPVNDIEGFDVSPFNKLIELSTIASDESIEPQPLWEYPCKALTEPFKIATINFLNGQQNTVLSNKGASTLYSPNECNGVALWTEIQLDDQTIISTGPIESVKVTEKVIWDRFTRQGVHFMRPKADCAKNPSTQLSYGVKFNACAGELKMTFDISCSS